MADRDALRLLEDKLESLALPPPGPGSDPNHPGVSLQWLVAMMRRTELAGTAPPTSDEARFDALMADRPNPDDQLGQLHIDAKSCLRRAALIEGKKVLAVGDDDGVSVALAMLGRRELAVIDLAVVDLDERVLEHLSAATATLGVALHTQRVDVLGVSVPVDLRRRFDAVVTDPFRDLDGSLGFLVFAAACLRPGGTLYWVDTPAWNYEHHEVRDAMRALGYEVRATHRSVHRYPLGPDSFDVQAIATAFDLDTSLLDRVVAQTSAFSDLYCLAKSNG